MGTAELKAMMDAHYEDVASLDRVPAGFYLGERDMETFDEISMKEMSDPTRYDRLKRSYRDLKVLDYPFSRHAVILSSRAKLKPDLKTGG